MIFVIRITPETIHYMNLKNVPFIQSMADRYGEIPENLLNRLSGSDDKG